MNKKFHAVVLISGLVVASVAAAQGVLLDAAANKVIQKYQTSSCDQLKQAKAAPPSEREMRAVQFLHNDATARQAFLDKVAGPIANKLFECGMIP